MTSDDRLRRFKFGSSRLLAWVAGAGAACFLWPAAPSGALAQRAHLARTVQVNETAHLHLTSHRGITLNEEGTATGTIAGRIFIHMQLRSGGRVLAEVNIYPRGGSLSGSGTAGYKVVGSYASFSGSFAVTHGTGRYAHAHASGMRFAGSIQRRTDAVSVVLSGKLSE